MLMVVPITLEVGSKRVESYAFLDPGSKCTLVTEETAQQLAIPGKTRNIKFDGFHEQGTTMPSRRVALTIKSCEDTTRYRITGVYTVPKIVIGNRAKYEAFCPGTRWPYLKRVRLPAIDASRVTVLLGMDNADALICDDHVRPPRGTAGPVAFKTQFGWALGGSVSKVTKKSDRRVHYVSPGKTDERLAEILERFQTIEAYGNAPITRPLMSEEDERGEDILKNTAVCVDSEWTVSLMFKEAQPKMPCNEEHERQRFGTLEKRFRRDTGYAEKYAGVVQRYLDERHAEEETPEEAATRPPGRGSCPITGYSTQTSQTRCA